jgi:hypothetical protein
MVKQKAEDVKKEIEQQEKEVYGDTTISGSAPDPSSDDDVEEVVEDAMGEETSEEIEDNKVVTLAEEVEETEENRRSK